MGKGVPEGQGPKARHAFRTDWRWGEETEASGELQGSGAWASEGPALLVISLCDSGVTKGSAWADGLTPALTHQGLTVRVVNASTLTTGTRLEGIMPV